jgi:hypothetical protein
VPHSWKNSAEYIGTNIPGRRRESTHTPLFPKQCLEYIWRLHAWEKKLEYIGATKLNEVERGENTTTRKNAWSICPHTRKNSVRYIYTYARKNGAYKAPLTQACPEETFKCSIDTYMRAYMCLLLFPLMKR